MVWCKYVLYRISWKIIQKWRTSHLDQNSINYKLTLIRHSYFLDKWCWAVLYWLFSDRACWLLLWNRFDENQMEDCCKSLDPSLWCMKSCPPLQHAILGLQVRHNNISFKWILFLYTCTILFFTLFHLSTMLL